MVLNIVGRDDIVLYLPFNEGTGSTLHDYGRDLLTGTINNDDLLWYKIPNGSYSLWHDGSTDYTFFTPTTSLTDYPVTLMGWGKIDQSSANTFVCIADSSVSDELLDIGTNNLLPKMTARTSAGEVITSGTTTMEVDKWYFLTAVFVSATERYLYLNGELEASSTTSRTFPPSNIRLAVGARCDSTPGNYMFGELSDSWIIDRGLSQEEIRAIYKATYRS